MEGGWAGGGRGERGEDFCKGLRALRAPRYFEGIPGTPVRQAAQKYTPPPGPGFHLKGIQAWIPFKRNPGPGVDVYFWAAYLDFMGSPWTL